jgi:hypothetical protein
MQNLRLLLRNFYFTEAKYKCSVVIAKMASIGGTGNVENVKGSRTYGLSLIGVGIKAVRITAMCKIIETGW